MGWNIPCDASGETTTVNNTCILPSNLIHCTFGEPNVELNVPCVYKEFRDTLTPSSRLYRKGQGFRISITGRTGG